MVMFLLILFSVFPGNDLESGNHYFTADWCGYCRAQKRIILRLEKEGYEFTEHDIDECPELLKKYGITGVPMIIIVPKDGKILKLKGLRTAVELRKKLL